jgi:pyruvate/2-oxoglutarate dehydrogenase complex dihydrolipoamide dehydrogenase (E3) component
MSHHPAVVISAGAGGLNAARHAVELGREVLLVERFRPGGECTWAGCIPSKALIEIAQGHHTARRFGAPPVDGAAVMDEVRRLTAAAHQAESVPTLEGEGISFLHGNARFVDPHTLDVDGTLISADHIIVATGCRAALPPIEGLDAVDILTNENVFQLTDLPSSLLVLGAGAIGAELSQAFARLGVDVTLVEMADSILPNEEEDLVETSPTCPSVTEWRSTPDRAPRPPTRTATRYASRSRAARGPRSSPPSAC